MYLDIPTETFSGFWMLRGFFLLRSCWKSDTNSWPSTGSKVNKSKNLSASRKSMRNIMNTHIFWSIQKSYATSQLHHFKRWKSKAKKTMAASKHRPRPSIACVKKDVSLPLPLISNFILPAMSRPWPYNPQPTFPPLPRSPAGAGPSSPSSVGLREALRSIAAEVERGERGRPETTPDPRLEMRRRKVEASRAEIMETLQLGGCKTSIFWLGKPSIFDGKPFFEPSWAPCDESGFQPILG